MHPAVRRPGPGDAAALRGLNVVFAATFGEPEPNAAAPPPDDVLRGLLCGPQIRVFVAEDAGAALGTREDVRQFDRPVPARGVP